LGLPHRGACRKKESSLKRFVEERSRGTFQPENFSTMKRKAAKREGKE